MTLDEIKANKGTIVSILESLARQYGDDVIKAAIHAWQNHRIHKQADSAIAEIHDAAEKRRRESLGEGHE